MTDINTAAIRAGIFGNPAKVIYDLCDALDAERADSISVRIESRANAERLLERIELLETTWVNDDCWHHMEDRAMAAEAEAADLNDQLQDALGAEGTHWARITEALKLHQPSQGMCETCGTDYPCLTRRALLGGLDA